MLKNENKTVSFWLSCFVCSLLPTLSLAACAPKASLRHPKQKPVTLAVAQHSSLWPLSWSWMGEKSVLWCHDMKGMQQFQAGTEGHICISVCSFQRINSDLMALRRAETMFINPNTSWFQQNQYLQVYPENLELERGTCITAKKQALDEHVILHCNFYLGLPWHLNCKFLDWKKPLLWTE